MVEVCSNHVRYNMENNECGVNKWGTNPSGCFTLYLMSPIIPKQSEASFLNGWYEFR